MRPTTRKWLAGGLVVAVLVVPFAVRELRGERGTEVDIATATPQPVRPTILASGVLAYGTEVTLTAEVVAKVTEILVEEGDMVDKGQVLMRLDPETYRNAVEREAAGRRQSRIAIERQRAALRLREAQFERTRQLYEQQLVDRNRFEEDRHALEVARAELATSSQNLQRAEAVLGEAYDQLGKTEIRAPIAGRVVSLPIKVGETAIPSTMSLAGAQLAKIADTTALLAELKVDEADIGKVAIGQRVDVYPAAFQDTPLPGTVEKVALAPTIEGQARAYKVTVRLDSPKGLNLRSGMSARADLYLGDGRPQLAVPVEAIVEETADDGGTATYVWIEREGSAQRVAVKPGLSDDRWQAIASGLQPGARIITGPARILRDLDEGEPVVQREDESEAADGEKDPPEGDAA